MVELVRTAMYPLHGDVSQLMPFIEMVWYRVIDPLIENRMWAGVMGPTTTSRWHSLAIATEPTMIDAQDLFYAASRNQANSIAYLWSHYAYQGNSSARLLCKSLGQGSS